MNSNRRTAPKAGSKHNGPLDASVLPTGVASRFIAGVNGLDMHVLEAGRPVGPHEPSRRPVVLLLHGFPELAYSWRYILPLLADAGLHAVAPDLRGYGRTSGADATYDGDLASYGRLNIVRDVLGLVVRLGYSEVYVVGHDFGSPIAAWCALVRPDVFTRLVMMSAPFTGPPSLPRVAHGAAGIPDKLDRDLAHLARPRKHYQRFYQTGAANADMWQSPQGVHAFLRAYYHVKSGDWPLNQPFRLTSRTAAEMARMPTYYIMDMAQGMAETVAAHAPTAEEVAGNCWLPDGQLAVYASEFERTGFQGGLNYYRSGGVGLALQQLFAGRTIDQPSMFVAGASDWGAYQNPGALERMRNDVCTDFRGVHLVAGAGHWVQQERPEETAELLLDFLA